MHSHLRSRTPSAVRASLLAAALATLGTSAFAEIRVMCYQDGNECDVTADLIKRYERQNPGAKVILDVVPYKTVVEQLPIQLARLRLLEPTRAQRPSATAVFACSIEPRHSKTRMPASSSGR